MIIISAEVARQMEAGGHDDGVLWLPENTAVPQQPTDTGEFLACLTQAMTRDLAEVLLPDPLLMGSPEGDLKGLRELQEAARDRIREYEQEHRR